MRLVPPWEGDMWRSGYPDHSSRWCPASRIFWSASAEASIYRFSDSRFDPSKGWKSGLNQLCWNNMLGIRIPGMQIPEIYECQCDFLTPIHQYWARSECHLWLTFSHGHWPWCSEELLKTAFVYNFLSEKWLVGLRPRIETATFWPNI